MKIKRNKIIYLLPVLLFSCTDVNVQTKKLNKPKLDSLDLIINREIESGNYQKASDINETILKNDSSDYRFYQNKSLVLFYNKKYTQALLCINKSMRLNNNAYINHIKGRIYAAMNLYDSAIFYYRKAYTIDPKPVYVTLAAEYLNDNDKHLEAINLIDSAITREPSNLKLHGHKAAFLTRIEKYDEAVKNYNIAEKEYKSDEIYAGRGFSYTYLDKFKEALSDLDIAIKLNPNDSRYFDWRGLVKFKLKDFDGAYDDFKHAAEMGNADGQHHLEKLQEKMKKTKSI